MERNRMAIRFVKAGLMTTVQDLGRTGGLRQGVPQSGAADKLSAILANKLAGNADSEAVLEFTYGNVSFVAESTVFAAFSGQGSLIFIDGSAVQQGQKLRIERGSMIELRQAESGVRMYMAITGGFDVPVVMGSRSTYLPGSFGGFKGRALASGDVLCSRLAAADPGALAGRHHSDPSFFVPRSVFLSPDPYLLRVIPGPELNWFRGSSLAGFFTDEWTVGTDSNRMGLRFVETVLELTEPREMISTAVVPGTIQVSNSGMPVLLMSDCQTTGGYPRIACVIEQDLPHCAQLRPGDTVRFSAVSVREAERMYLTYSNDLAKLDAGLRIRKG
jgi:antagonist of KipI